MSMQKRVIVSLAVSVCLAILLLVLGNRSQSELLFYAQWPGFLTIASIFGMHGGREPNRRKECLGGSERPRILAPAFCSELSYKNETCNLIEYPCQLPT
jgi:hypothetical protein